jgi:PAS domain S-box-containing protein
MVIKDRDNLRMRAEARLGVVNDDISIMSGEEIRKIINELRTCQIELEMQNEELREAQSESEESRRDFIEFYDYTPTAYLTINDDGQIIKANLTASHLLGEARKFLLNQPLTTFIFTEDHDTLYLSRKKLLKTKMKQSCNLRIQKKGGNLLSAQLEIFVIPKIDGEQGQFRAIITDITERKRTEELIINAKKEWEKTFDAMSDIVTIQDKDMRIIRANKAAYDVFQVEPGALNGRYCYEIFREASTPCLNCPELLTLKEEKIHGAHITHKRC